MGLDKDLASIQEARDYCKMAKEAQLEFKNYNQEQVDKIVKAMADAGVKEAERLAKLAHEETGFGKWQDKKAKNIFGSQTIYESIKDMRTVGVINSLYDGKLLEIADPMGVVAALIPSTNPTSTSFYKCLISIKARNSIVASPHPRSVKCTLEAFAVLSDAAEKAGAPKNLMKCLTMPTLEGTNELMKNPNVAIILATGNTPMVKAAYSSGKPAYGVGPGNTPVFIERTANVKKAVADICAGKTFDNGVLCSTESSVIVDYPIDSLVREEFLKHGGFFVNQEERIKLEKAMFNRSAMNPEMVGKPAQFIAQKAGFNVPPDTEILIAELNGVGKEYPLSTEKLSPVLSYYSVDGWREACERCLELLQFIGIGHTMVIHSTDNDIIMKFALEKPAYRFLVNTVGSLGAAGYTNFLTPALTLGPGTIGGSITSLNITANHLLNIKRVAFETKPMHDKNGAKIDEAKMATHHPINNSSGKTWMNEIEERIRLKAGNPAIKSTADKSNEKKVSSGKVYGSGFTDKDIENVISNFKR